MKRQAMQFGFMALLVFSSVACAGQGRSSDVDQLHRAFVDPPHDFSIMPFWFWNGKMEGPIVQQQVREMVDQHVYGVFLHGRDGLQTPYLSEGWFKAIGAGLEQSKKSGFEFNFVDEYDWPSGEVRNIWMAGNHQSEVLAKRPDLRMKTLAYESQTIDGPRSVDLTVNPDSQAIVAARMLGPNQIDAGSLVLIDPSAKDGHAQWSAPKGQWIVVQFSLKPAMGFDGGFVDLLNPDATNLYFDLVYGEYHRRFGSYFGNTIRYAFADHEGDYGYRIAWTPKLFESFQERTGYDLRKMLPLLIYNGGDITTKLRTDYLATITDLYGHSFWGGLTKSAQSLGIGRTGHAWEESLQWAAALEGSMFMVERGLNPVGVDSLEDFGRQPLNFKIAQSVADFEGRRFACENQGVQGTDSYLDLEAIRKGTNGIGLWGVNLFIPHAFNYDRGRANYPPDWLHQPYWPYFHTYADYTRRISYMNADSHHETNVLLYYPITTMWADTQPLFSGSTPYQEIGKPAAWKNLTILINDYYTRIILGLADHHWDYDVADDEYLSKAKVEGHELVIGPQRFRAVVLPPITTLSRATLKKLEDFHRAGGIVIGIRQLPNASPETGGNDAEIKSGMTSIFGATATGKAATNANQPENSYYIDDSVDELISALDMHVPKDVKIVSGPEQHLYFQHRSKLQTEYYWVVNDTDRKRINEVHFAAKGIPERWDALTGERKPLLYTNTDSGTDVRLNLDSWDAFYVVFQPLHGATQPNIITATNAEVLDTISSEAGVLKVHLAGPASSKTTYVEVRSGSKLYRGEASGGDAQPLLLDGQWQFKTQPDWISVPYAKVSDASEAKGISQGWATDDFDDSSWPDAWLSEEQTTIRHWQMIGPFPNEDNNGFAKDYGPEREFDLQKKYDGLQGQVGWEDYDGDEPYLALNNWDIWMRTEGGNNSDSSYIVNFNPELQTDGHEWLVSYAHTYLYSPNEQHAQFIVAADNWTSIWLNHKQVSAQLRTPFWYELNDNWADHVTVDLHKGWNEVLVKVGKGRGTASGFYGFTFRVADEKGATLSQVVASTSLGSSMPMAETGDEMRWYRLVVPPGCVAIKPPIMHQSYRMLLNGHELHAKGDTPIELGQSLQGEKNSLVIMAHKDDPLVAPIQFVTGVTPFSLKPWTQTGLENFSGTAVYTKSFTIPENYRDKSILLDLGRVSSVADVFINGNHASTLVWRPYQVDITKLIKPGQNEIKIAVTNTEANARAVGTWRHILGSISVDGLEGPVRLIPYVNQVVTLRPEQNTSAESGPGRR